MAMFLQSFFLRCSRISQKSAGAGRVLVSGSHRPSFLSSLQCLEVLVMWHFGRRLKFTLHRVFAVPSAKQRGSPLKLQVVIPNFNSYDFVLLFVVNNSFCFGEQMYLPFSSPPS